MSLPTGASRASIVIEQIAIGDELLRGLVVDENSAWLGREAASLGLEIAHRQIVADRIDDIVAAYRLATSRSTWVVVSGGLGPTVDDLTAEAAAVFLGESVALNAEALEQIATWRAARARLDKSAPASLQNLDEKQAWLPASADVLMNPVGTAPGFRIRSGGTTFVHFPGVPREYKKLAQLYFLGPLRDAMTGEGASGSRTPISRTWKFFGLTESAVAEHVNALFGSGRLDELTLHYRAHFPEIHLTIVSHSTDRVAALERHIMQDSRIRHRLFGEGDATFAGALLDSLVERGETLSVAESCTGGLIGQMLTTIPGASRAFMGGIIAYDNAVKTALLDVSPEVLGSFGAVSRECAEAMARGARAKLGTTWSVAVTGIAGPGGGTADKPVGTIHFAVAGEHDVHHRSVTLPFERDRNRLASAYGALDLLRRQLALSPQLPVRPTA